MINVPVARVSDTGAPSSPTPKEKVPSCWERARTAQAAVDGQFQGLDDDVGPLALLQVATGQLALRQRTHDSAPQRSGAHNEQ